MSTDPNHAACVSDDDYAGYGRSLEALTRENAALRLALSYFANPQHWAVSRRFATPEHVWIGTVQTHPSVLAREALNA